MARIIRRASQRCLRNRRASQPGGAAVGVVDSGRDTQWPVQRKTADAEWGARARAKTLKGLP